MKRIILIIFVLTLVSCSQTVTFKNGAWTKIETKIFGITIEKQERIFNE